MKYTKDFVNEEYLIIKKHSGRIRLYKKSFFCYYIFGERNESIF